MIASDEVFSDYLYKRNHHPEPYKLQVCVITSGMNVQGGMYKAVRGLQLSLWGLISSDTVENTPISVIEHNMTGHIKNRSSRKCLYGR